MDALLPQFPYSSHNKPDIAAFGQTKPHIYKSHNWYADVTIGMPDFNIKVSDLNIGVPYLIAEVPDLLVGVVKYGILAEKGLNLMKNGRKGVNLAIFSASDTSRDLC